MISNERLAWMAVIIAAGILLVYIVFPRLFKNYQAEKGVKLMILYFILGYLSYDFYLKEKYLYVGFFVVGAALYTYLTIIAKKKS